MVLRYTLNSSNHGYGASALRWLGSPILSPYSARHWHLGQKDQKHKWGHRVIAVVQAVPLVGLAASLLERGIVSLIKEKPKPLAERVSVDSSPQKTPQVTPIRQEEEEIVDVVIEPPPPIVNDHALEEAFFEAIQNGSPQDYLDLPSHIDITYKNKDNESFLMQAAEKNLYEVCVQLIDKGAAISDLDKDGNSALAYAAAGGHKDLCTLLIEKGADVVATDNDGNPPLWYAVDRGHLDVCELLIKARADLSVVDQDGSSLLMTAAAEGHKKICKLLINHGAEISTVNKMGYTALMKA